MDRVLDLWARPEVALKVVAGRRVTAQTDLQTDLTSESSGSFLLGD